MNNIEACTLLVRLYAVYQSYHGEDVDYAEAVARAVAALSKDGDNDGQHS